MAVGEKSLWKIVPAALERVQITTDGHRVYLDAVENAFGADIDYAMLQKIYGAVADNETRYSQQPALAAI